MDSLSSSSTESVEFRMGELIRAGRFADSLALAEKLPATPAKLRRDWFAIIFSAWARAVPSEAPALADILRRQEADSDPVVFQAFVRGWADSAPAGLAGHAITLPAGENRAFALATALERWTLLAPAEVAEWMSGLTDPGEFDRAAALLVERTDAVHRPTATALSMAENLSDPALRLHALAHVLREWAASDPAAARHFAETSESLSREQRAVLLAALTPPATET